MSGGAWEYVMGNYNDMVGNSGLSTMPDLKYYNKYTSSIAAEACNGSECLSHGLSETASWYDDFKTMTTTAYPWLLRGGDYGYNASAGVFSFGIDIGYYYVSRSFRLVMSPSI